MIAEIALNLPLRRTFDYLVPAGDEARVQPGCRVIVPFGRRITSGVVVELKQESAVAPDRLKAVHQPADGGALFSAEMLRFTRWIGEYYFCGWGEVLDGALPSGLAVKIRTLYSHNGDSLSDKSLKSLSPAIRDFLRRHGEWDEPQWKKSGATADDLQWLWRQRTPGGGLTVRYQYAGTRSKPRMEKWVRPTGALPAPSPVRRNPKKETRREKVLRLLREEGEVAMVRLKSVVSSPSEVVKSLAGEGLAEIVEKQAASRFHRPAKPEPFLELNPDQASVMRSLSKAFQRGAYHGFLLEGVTGSGKTEIYIHAVREALGLGKSCLVLVPEIALTENIVHRFRARFGDEVAVLHSGMGEGERFDEWRRVHGGGARIVIGARSAVFAPLSDLGLVVVDEEHDSSYKQDEAPRYHGRDAAIMRAHQCGAVVVLGSATPSLEAMHNVALGKLERMVLPARIENRPLPEVEILDLKSQPRQKGSPLFTRYLVESIREVLLRKEQAIIFLNRRGFANVVRCPECETVVLCDHCSITLTYHAAENRLRCHRCDFNRPVPRSCPECGGAAPEVLGLGTERIEQEMGVMFPDARILRMDGDTLRRRGELERMLEGIRRRDYDLIIGTQVLSKGHDYPYITLVGAVLADVSLNLPDFRAAERTFQLLTQVAGRAGRGELPGRVLIQTYSPRHYSLEMVRTHDTAGFTERELQSRQEAGTPPYCSQTLVWVTGPRVERVEALAHELARRFRKRNGGGVVVMGAAEGPIRKIKNRYRWMILLKAASIRPIHALLRQVLDDSSLRVGATERIAVDVDPYHVM